MALEHIGRKQSIGLGKESVSGTSVAAARWIPKIDGQFTPTNTTADDTGAYGVIDELRDQQTVKTITTVDFSCDLRDIYAGDLFMALFGTETPCVRFPIPGSITGTFSVGETITESTSNATGVLKRADVGGTSKVLFISVATGTFTGGQTLTGGTSGATATGGTIEAPASVRSHVYTLQNTNTHPSYTIYGSDPVGDSKSVYCMLDTLDLDLKSGAFALAKAKFMGKKIQSASAQTPSYTAQNAFLAKYANFYAASSYSGLDAAAATTIKSMTLSWKKNLVDFQGWGATDVTGFYNQQYTLTGSFVLLYNASTFRDYVTNSTTQAFRVKLANTDVTIGSASNPTIQIDIPVASFKDWKRTTANNSLVEQTLDFKCSYDVATAMTAGLILTNTSSAAY